MENELEQAGSETPDRGANFEKLAFNFCKAATIVLLAGRYALPVASGGAAVFFFLAHCNGKRETRCILNKPIVAAAFWAVVFAVSMFLMWRK